MGLLESIPLPVDEFSAEALEWEKLRELLAGFARSSPGRTWLRSLAPSRDVAWITDQHSLVQEALELVRNGIGLPLEGIFDPTDLLDQARIPGASLEAEGIRDLLQLLDSIAAWQGILDHPPESVAGRLPVLTAYGNASASSSAASLARSLRSRLNPDGDLADHASPELRRLRGQIARQKQAIQHSLAANLRRLSEGGEAREDLITIRGERFVIPVKAEFKRRIPGVVHGTSSSGQTVFLEPLEALELNNDLVRLLEEEQNEITRIFAAMTAEIGASAEAIREGAAALIRLDAVAARARFAVEYDCVRPQFADSTMPRLALEAARHPLLEQRLRSTSAKVVPLTFSLEDGARQLVISGPNTGGKTVALKTAGLLALMAQSGVPVPAAQAVFPLFDAFLADIGDAQSIELNLSTFSAHISNLNRIAALADRASLVLLDELGSGTDPEEGSALAVAIAEHFVQLTAWCLISTHHAALKVWATGQPGVTNAAVGLDPKTLAPTYELRLGVPGASAGIEVARRLGLDPSIVAAARARLSSQTREIAEFLDRLHSDLDAAAVERAAIEKQKREVAAERSRLDQEGLKEWRAKVRELEKQLESLFREMTYQSRTALEQIADRASREKLSKEADRRLARLRREFSEQFNSIVVARHGEADRDDRYAQPHLLQKVSPGDRVVLKSLGKAGRILRQIDADRFEVEVGSMKVRAERSELAAPARPQAPTPIEAAKRRGISVLATQPVDLNPEINLIGHTVDEAAAEVDRFLDQAYLAGLTRVRIVHGIGKGILRKTLREQLAHHPHVERLADAEPNEGGPGATIVSLKS